MPGRVKGSKDYLTNPLNYCILFPYLAYRDQGSRYGRHALQRPVASAFVHRSAAVLTAACGGKQETPTIVPALGKLLEKTHAQGEENDI